MRAMFYGNNDILNNFNSYEIISINKKSYNSFFKDVDKSNYMQFSSYAEAKNLIVMEYRMACYKKLIKKLYQYTNL